MKDKIKRTLASLLVAGSTIFSSNLSCAQNNYPKPTETTLTQEDSEWIKEFDLDSDEVLKFKQAGFYSLQYADLITNNVPLEYAISKKSKFSFSRISMLYNSPLRNSKISDKKTKEIYGDKIHYTDFGDLEKATFGEDENSESRLEVPKDLAIFLISSYNRPRIENPNKFQKQIFEQAIDLGYKDFEKLKSLPPKQAIQLAVDITARKMSYLDVDHDQGFIKKYGKHLPHDEYFKLRIGDCDKYRFVVQAIFDYFKTFNPHLKNVYIASEWLGAEDDKTHSWNSITIIQKNRIVCSHIDPTTYDGLGQTKEALESASRYIDRKNFTEDFLRDLATKGLVDW